MKSNKVEYYIVTIVSLFSVKGIKGLRVADASIMPQSTGTTRSSVIMIGEKAADIIKKDQDRQRSQTFRTSVKTTEAQPTMDSLTASVFDTNQPQLVKLENPEPLDPITAPLSSASEADLLSMFEELVMDPAMDLRPSTETKAGSLTDAVDLGTGILDKSGRLTEDALLKLVGAASGSPSLNSQSNTQQFVEKPAMSQPSRPLEIAKAARNTIKHTKEDKTVDISTADIFAEIQNLSMDVQRMKPAPKQPASNPLRIERKRVSSDMNAKSQSQNTGVLQQHSIKNTVNPTANQISAPKRHRVIDMHSLLREQPAAEPTNKVVDMHSLLNGQSFSLATKDSTVPNSFVKGGAVKAVSKQDRERGLRLLTESMQRSRVSSAGMESLFDQHMDAFPNTESDVLNFARDAGSLQANTLRTQHLNHRRNPLFS